MTAQQFADTVSSLSLRKNDVEWFPRWVFRYTTFLKLNRRTKLPVTRDQVVRFSRQLRDRGVPAWQQLQAVRAVDCYRKHILQK